MELRIPLSDLDYGAEEEQAVLEVLRRRWLTMGGVTQEFEKEFAGFVGANHAFGVSNGTDALHLAALAAAVIGAEQWFPDVDPYRVRHMAVAVYLMFEVTIKFFDVTDTKKFVAGDTFYLPDGSKATSNGPLIDAIVRIARDAGREIASPAEARGILHVQ